MSKRLHAWLLKDGELLPIQEGSRPMRTSMIADALLARGHRVTWWASTFSHQRKALMADGDTRIDVAPSYALHLLEAGTYARNVSPARYRHHRRLGRRFAEAAAAAAPPDVIVAAYPVIELAAAAVGYARARGIPCVVDVRDLWPDTFLDHLSPIIRPAARLALTADFHRSARTLAQADSVVAMSEAVLSWARQRGRRTAAADRVFAIGHPGRAARQAGERPAWLGDPGSLVVAYIGAFGRTSDLHTVVSAARRLWVEGVRDVRFVLAGDGDLRRAVAGAAADLPNVVCPGWLNEPGATALLAEAHLALLPWSGLAGAMPNKLFDYLSAGVPVVSSAAGELASLLDREGAGWSYPAHDADALALTLRQLRGARPRVAHAAARARELFARRFQAAAIYPSYAEHIEAVAATALRPAA